MNTPDGLYQLRSSIRAAIEATPPGVSSRDALVDAYEAFHPLVRAIAVSAARTEQFDALCPELSFPSRQIRGGGPKPIDGKEAHTVASRLARLEGWLTGFVEEAEAEKRAEQYARDRLKLEDH